MIDTVMLKIYLASVFAFILLVGLVFVTVGQKFKIKALTVLGLFGILPSLYFLFRLFVTG